MQTFRSAVALGLALVLAASIGTYGMLKAKSAEQTLVVTGSARRRITSDKAIWRLDIARKDSTVAAAYQSLNSDVPKVRAFLKEQGVPETEIMLSSITSEVKNEVDANGRDTGRVGAYVLSQSVEVRSSDVSKIGVLSREAVGRLLQQDILVSSQAPEYLYTKLGDLKVQMLAEAAKDAKSRAESVAASVGSRIGGVRAARMGVLQITPADSTDVSSEGRSDTTSVEKDITSVMSVTFGID
jgi:uncharacterized protein